AAARPPPPPARPPCDRRGARGPAGGSAWLIVPPPAPACARAGGATPPAPAPTAPPAPAPSTPSHPPAGPAPAPRPTPAVCPPPLGDHRRRGDLPVPLVHLRQRLPVLRMGQGVRDPPGDLGGGPGRPVGAQVGAAAPHDVRPRGQGRHLVVPHHQHRPRLE